MIRNPKPPSVPGTARKPHAFSVPLTDRKPKPRSEFEGSRVKIGDGAPIFPAIKEQKPRSEERTKGREKPTSNQCVSRDKKSIAV